MTEIRLFQYNDDSAEEIAGATVELEHQIQQVVEQHMESLSRGRPLGT